jgi:hypothetical protein
MRPLRKVWTEFFQAVDSDHFPEGADVARVRPEKMEIGRVTLIRFFSQSRLSRHGHASPVVHS